MFLAIPGLHVESDYLIAHKVPVFGGRDDPESLAKSGANGLMLTEAIEPTLEKWSAFGKYYLDSGAHKPCMIHPESGVSGDWNNHEKILVAKFKKYGMTFTDIITYQDDVSTAQQQANTIAARAKTKGCDQVFFMAVNPIALVFFTQAATQNLWFPLWTFTSYMVLADTELAGRLMDQRQWDNAVGPLDRACRWASTARKATARASTSGTTRATARASRPPRRSSARNCSRRPR